ncbi:MAG: ATP-dependent helicase, partial [Candidatus Methanomethylophilaceae archaeon]|nr:ATP-dependent helicase [Candidatus Methanomethylophilaceae archaeon]
IATRAIIGTLDESFVATFEDDFNTFIAKGRTWRVVEQREEEILVEEARTIGAVPSWTGSDIPVPYEVAMEVGTIRRIRDLSGYKVNGNAVSTVLSYLGENDARWVMPTDRTVTLEYGEGLAILNTCFGTCVNETISKIYSALLVARIGESVGVSTDPYRIIVELPRFVSKDILIDTFRLIRPGTIEALARKTIINSTFLRWRFAYVAKKFGIIEKNADHRFINFTKLFDLHNGTPAYLEAIDKVLWEDLDIENTEKAISMIDSGEIELVPQPISRIGLEGITRSKELMQPLRADHTILVALKKRLQDEVLFASCINCQNQWRVRVRDAPREFICPRCGGLMVALLKEYDREAIKICGKDRDLFTDEEKKTFTKLRKVANLVSTNGQRAAIVLAGRGVGAETASRILRSSYRDEDDFLREIMSAEVTFAKNKRFWD